MGVTQKIIELCTRAGHPEPEFEEIAGSMVVIFRPASGNITPQVTTQVAPQDTPQVTTEVSRILELSVDPISRESLQRGLNLRDWKNFQITYLKPALASGLIEMTIPNKPNNRLQKYQLTAKGKAWLKRQKET